MAGRGEPWRTGINGGGSVPTRCTSQPTVILACALALWDTDVGPFVVMPIDHIQGSHIAYTATTSENTKIEVVVGGLHRSGGERRRVPVSRPLLIYSCVGYHQRLFNDIRRQEIGRHNVFPR